MSGANCTGTPPTERVAGGGTHAHTRGRGIGERARCAEEEAGRRAHFTRVCRPYHIISFYRSPSLQLAAATTPNPTTTAGHSRRSREVPCRGHHQLSPGTLSSALDSLIVRAVTAPPRPGSLEGAGRRASSTMTLSKPSYQPVAGGETHSFPPDHSVPHERRRKRHRQAAVLSGLLVSASILILVLAFKRHPEWKVPVGYFDTSTSSSASDASTVHPDPYDTLPQIDWSWSKPDKTSWWSSTGRQPKVGTQEWLRRYPDFVHGPTPRQVSVRAGSNSVKRSAASWMSLPVRVFVCS